MNKVVVRIFGGIGNQLFCYAAARRLALANNAELVIDNISGFLYDYNYKRHYQLDHFNIFARKANKKELFFPFPRIQRFLFRYWYRHKPFLNRKYIMQNSNEYNDLLLQIKPKGTVYLEGYWQSEKYFKDVESIIREDLQITAPLDEANIRMASRMRSHSSVAIHIRFFDAKFTKSDNNISIGYYLRAINHIQTLVPEAHFYLFSDKPELARSVVSLSDDRITVVTHNQGDENAYYDLWLMTQCHHFIIANSTFSWWGAWLSPNEDKYVIAPKFINKSNHPLSSWGFEGLLPDSWIVL